MDIFNYITQRPMLIAAMVFIVAMTLYGHYRGLVRMLVSVASMVITLIAVDLIMPYAREYLTESGALDGLRKGIGERLALGMPETDYSGLYELIGVDEIAEDLSYVLGGLLLNAICFIMLFILIRILLRFIISALDLITSIPVISGLNQIGGAIVGFLEAVFYIWIVMAIAAMTPGYALSGELLRECAEGGLLGILYSNNLITELILGIFGL